MAGKSFVKWYKRGFHWGKKGDKAVTCDQEVRKWREKCSYKSELEDTTHSDLMTSGGEDERTQAYAALQHGGRC